MISNMQKTIQEKECHYSKGVTKNERYINNLSHNRYKMKHSEQKVEEAIRELIGEDVIPIVEFLKGKENISEFVISENIGIEVNKIRNILYRMHTHHVVTYHRKKDRVKGWYISYWTLNSRRMQQIVDELKQKKLETMKEKLAREEENENAYFLCPQLCIRVDFDKATDFGFFCPECGSLLHQQDNSRTISNLKERIKGLEIDIEKDRKKEEKIQAKITEKIEAEALAEEQKKLIKKASKKKPKKTIKKTVKKSAKSEKKTDTGKTLKKSAKKKTAKAKKR
jgi:transcription initiation factor TFIIE subunit alpha